MVRGGKEPRGFVRRRRQRLARGLGVKLEIRFARLRTRQGVRREAHVAAGGLRAPKRRHSSG